MNKAERSTGGLVQSGSAAIIGEGGCGFSLPAACDCARQSESGAPANITVNIHGAVYSDKDLARIVREQVLQFNRRNGN